MLVRLVGANASKVYSQWCGSVKGRSTQILCQQCSGSLLQTRFFSFLHFSKARFVGLVVEAFLGWSLIHLNTWQFRSVYTQTQNWNLVGTPLRLNSYIEIGGRAMRYLLILMTCFFLTGVVAQTVVYEETKPDPVTCYEIGWCDDSGTGGDGNPDIDP